MRSILKKPPGYAYLRSLYRRAKLAGKLPKDVFTDIYVHNRWANTETVSGEGSTLNATLKLRKELAAFMHDHKITSIIDIPCGDFNWMKEMDLTGISYLGGDIVEDLITKNNLQYGSRNIHFKVLDVLTDELPDTDLLIAKDLLVHFSYAHIEAALQNMKNSKPKYIALTSFPLALNKDIVTGEWRPLNMQAHPFNLGEPLIQLEENTEAGKYVCIWKTASTTSSF